MFPKQIAIIDDEEEMEDIYSLILEPILKNNLATIKFYSDSRTFLAEYESNLPDLILCDINMPHLDGPALCHQIRESGHQTRICFVSGHNHRDYLKVMDALDVDRFFSKPLNPMDVLSSCEQDLGLLPANS